MFNYATQRHLTHILLIDAEPVEIMQELVQNARQLYSHFCEIAGKDRYHHYSLRIVFPETRTDLASPANELVSRLKQEGIDCGLYDVKDADMFLVKGKAGLLVCSLWLMAGAVLLNDVPLSTADAGSLLTLANREEGIHLLDRGLHAALIGNQTTIDNKLLRLPAEHDLSDVLRTLGAGERRGHIRLGRTSDGCLPLVFALGMLLLTATLKLWLA
ncbi:MAG: hypothetical protein ABII79_06505 [bacterium]